MPNTQDNQKKLVKTLDRIKELAVRKFWGGLEIKFEDGVPVHIKIIENVKP